MGTLLLLTDFSANATYAAEYGYHLAGQLGANIMLCNVITVPVEVPLAELAGWTMEEDNLLHQGSEQELTRLKKHLEYRDQSKGFHPGINTINYSGTVTEVMENAVESNQINMVVMGTHHSSSLRDLLLSNHNQSMIDQATAPLLLVPAIAPKANIRRIAFATDLRQIEVDLENIYALIAFARPLHADILITHIEDEDHLSPLSAKQLEKLLTEISNKADYPRIYYKLISNSHPEAGLEWICRNEQIGMLAIVPRKHNFVDRLISGSLTQKIAKHMAIPLLVFPMR